MITCIGSGGHAKALELISSVKMVNLLPEDSIPDDLAGELIIGVGAPSVAAIAARRTLVERLVAAGKFTFPSYRVDGKKVFRDGMGIQMFSRVHLGPGSKLGAFCILNTRATVEHDAFIGSFVHVAPGAMVLGGASIGDGCLVGAGAIVMPCIHVAERVAIGAGAVVTDDIETPGTVVAGIPAREFF